MPSSRSDDSVDRDATSTPDALDPATLDEVEKALAATQSGGSDTTDVPNPAGESTKPGGVARPDGGIPPAEVVQRGGVVHPDGGIPHPVTTNPDVGVAHPVGGIPRSEVVRSGGSGYLDTDSEPVRTSDRRPVDYDG